MKEIKNLPELLKKIARRRLLVIGDVMLDRYLWGDATRISPEAPVPVVHVIRETETMGGAANVANNIAALGARVEVVGAIGQDENGASLRRLLQAGGIGFDEDFVLEQVRTISKTRVVVRNQQLCRLDREEGPDNYRSALANSKVLPRLEAKIAAADGVILSDYAKGILTTEIIGHISGLARSHGKFIALDPKPASGVQFRDLDLITPNRRESDRTLRAEARLRARGRFRKICAAIWKKYGAKNLVITLGADGMLISAHGRVMRRIDTAARQVYDVSGAGDTVIAALAARP